MTGEWKSRSTDEEVRVKKKDMKLEKSKKDMASDKRMGKGAEKSWVKSVQKKAGFNYGGMAKGKKGC